MQWDVCCILSGMGVYLKAFFFEGYRWKGPMGHAGGKPEQAMCAEFCSWSLFRGQPPVFKNTVLTKTGRDRGALLRKE